MRIFSDLAPLPMLYSAITKPHLWGTDTLQEARLECVDNLKSTRLKPETRQSIAALLAAIDAQLAARHALPRKPRR